MFVGLSVCDFLVPNPNVDLQKWAVIACDQFTSQPEYWKQVEDFIGLEASALRLVLPENYLNTPQKEACLSSIRGTMQNYLANGTLQNTGRGVIFVKRQTTTGMRRGLVLCADLEHYDYGEGSTSLIRTTEGTILDRLPPRIAIRKQAEIETSHIMVLFDDPQDALMNLFENEKPQTPLYDVNLMQQSGAMQGYFVPEGAETLQKAAQILQDILQKSSAQCQNPILYAVGDGNHSLATAKVCWEQLKADGAPMDHPARYAMIELVNIHDASLQFEPIHRVVFNCEPDVFLEQMENLAVSLGGKLIFTQPEQSGGHTVRFLHKDGQGQLCFTKQLGEIPVDSLQTVLDEMMKYHKQATLDYVHGEHALELGKGYGNLAFILPAIEKSNFFASILKAPLPRKAFSMGEAQDKRFYFECRKIR